MRESEVDGKLFRFFWEELGLWPQPSVDAIICPKCKTKILPAKGRPDILVLNPKGPSYVCEAKIVRPYDKSFSFSEITKEQRRWLTRWMEDSGLGFIGLGIVREHGKRDFLEHLYLIPWQDWLDAESLVLEHQKSIPVLAGKGYKKELQEQQLDILNLFECFELKREEGRWLLPKSLQSLMMQD